jgi:Fe-S cluster biogenesis protein NfuA/nitrite reductase/ring-hydroxylating ferredoxin subunit
MEDRRRPLNDEEFRRTTIHLDELIRQFEGLPMPQVQEKVFELLQTVDAFHREGISRFVEFLREEGLAETVEKAADDEAVRTLLVLYDLLPGDPLVEAEKALDSVRPYIHSHGGEVELLRVEEGIVHLRLSGACSGCAGSTVTLQRGIEAALRERVKGFKGIENHETRVETGKVLPNGLISFDEVDQDKDLPVMFGLPNAGLNAPDFKTAALLENLPPGTVLPAALENRNILLINVNGEVYATGAECPGTNFPLTYGILEEYYLTCPWHQEVFDVRSGKVEATVRKIDRLPIYPVAVVDGEVRVATNVAPRSIR